MTMLRPDYRSVWPKIAAVAVTLAICASGTASGRVLDASVERTAQGQLVLHWTDGAPVDVIEGEVADVAKGKLIASTVSKGHHEMPAPAHARPYFFLRDTRDQTVVTVAERVIPLDQGSNFRDLGGYPAADGKPVPRPQPLLTKDGTPYLTFALAEIDRRWGSMDAYLGRQLGVGAAQLAQLRKDYLE